MKKLFYVKKKGFTLIELLAVIVILAIILLIAMPIVLNVIGEARKGAFESSAYGLSKTSENECMANLVKGDSKIMEVVFEDGVITSEDMIAFSGRAPADGVIVINQNCKVQMAINDGYWCVQKAFNNKEVTVTRLSDMTEDCEITDFAGLIEWTLQENGKLTAILPSVSGPNVEYSLNGINWQSSRTFVDLEPGTTYTFRVRIAGVETDDLITVVSPNVYTITYGAGTGGSVDPLSKYVLEDEIALGPDVTENTGYDFVNFTVIEGSGNGDLNLSNGNISNVIGDMTIRANFSVRQYTVNYQSNQGATFSPNYRTVNHGSDATTPSVEIEEGYTFSHYTVITGVGNGELNTSTGNVTNVVGNMTIEASFVLNEYTVSYTTGIGGSVNTASRVVTHGGTSAAPGHSANTGYSFDNFSITSGSGNGTLNTSTGAVTNVIGNLTVRANFTINTYTVSYTASAGGGVGTGSEVVNWDSANIGTSATPSTGYSFTNFTITSGSCDGTFSNSTGICSSVREAITVRANFTINTYTVSYTASIGGSVTVSSRTVNHGGDSAAPGHTANIGYHFVDFERTFGSGGSLNTSTGAVTGVTGNQTIRANFEINQYTITYQAGTGGSVSPTSRVVDHGGTSAAVTPTPTTGYTFANFTVTSGAGNGTLNSSTGAVTNVTGAMTIQANFTLNSYTVSYTASTGGSVTVSSRTVSHGGDSAAPGHTANTGYHFVNFERTSGSGGTLNTSTGAVTNVTGNQTIRANFAINSYTVSYTAGTGGSVNPSSESVNWNSANNGTVANPSTGYSFTNYTLESGACNGTFSGATGVCSSVREAITVRANFTINSYTVNYQSNQGASFNPTFRTVTHGGSSTTPTITVDPGYTFSHYTAVSGVGNGDLNTSTGNVTNVIGNMTIEASFTLNEYTISYIASTGGTVSIASRVVTHGGTSAAPGHSANTGYTFSNFEITSGSGNGTLNTSTGAVTNVIGHMTVRANFTINTYTVSYTASTGGSVGTSSEVVNWDLANNGTSATPSTNYTFVNFTVESGACSGTFNNSTGICSSVREAMTIRANFIINTYTVTYTATTGGSVNTSSRVVAHGGTADAPGHTTNIGYHFTHFLMTSGTSGILNSSTGEVINVTENLTIQANFMLNSYIVTFDANSGSCSTSPIIVDHGSASTNPSCSRTNYTLNGYTLSVGSCAGTFTPSTGICSNVQQNMTIRADWTINSYTVTYNANGGSCTPTSRTINHGSTSAAPSCSRSGYTLSSFSRTSGSGGTLNTSTGEVTNVTGNQTITANWVTAWSCGQAVNWQGVNYATVQIGTQCWFAENLRATHNGCLSNAWNTNQLACRINGGSGWDQNEVLYQWKAAMNGSTTEGAQGLCPTGWKVPTDANWFTLTNFGGTNRITYISVTQGGIDTYGFNGLYTGGRLNDGTLYSVGSLLDLWTSTPKDSNAWRRTMLSGGSSINKGAISQPVGASVRCVKN